MDTSVYVFPRDQIPYLNLPSSPFSPFSSFVRRGKKVVVEVEGLWIS